MKVVIRVFLLILTVGLQPLIPAAQHTKAQLHLSHSTARAGDTITAALQLKMDPEWHTYWRNAGDAGIATSIEWELPPGITVGEIQWPAPKKHELAGLYTYIYEHEVWLLMPVRIGAEAKLGTVQLKGKASWLECQVECIPGESPVQTQLIIGDQQAPSPAADIIEKWRERIPKKDPTLKISGRWDGGVKDDARMVLIEWTPKSAPDTPDFFPFESEEFKVEGKSEVLQADAVTVTLRKEVKASDGKWPAVLKGLVLDRTTTEEPKAVEVEIRLDPGVAMAGTKSSPGPVAPGKSNLADTSLWVVLGFAFLGGLILNIMPCVLPVIALKILSFVNQSGAEPKRARQLGLVYASGVLASFLALAGIIIAVQKAGGIAAWGMQYQNPVFLISLTALVTLISLNLFGVFEVTLAGGALGKASELSSREGASGAFFNGVLATVLGTSCTAPFLAFAIGYALSQPAMVTILVFSMMAVGLAFPYVVLTWNPALLRLLPKPGAWMERFKVAMGFPMLATAVWLYTVAVKAHFSESAFWLALFLVLLALAAWIWGEFVQRGRKRRVLAKGLAAATVLVGVLFVLEGRLHWRNPVYTESGGSGEIKNVATGIQWQKWSTDGVAKARAEGHPVLIDFTADWCLNCQRNKITSLEIEPVEKKLKEINAVAFLADFTRKNPEIAAELKRFNRSAVPLVLVYPADPNAEAIVLPPWLTPEIVLEALDKAAGPTKSSSEKAAGDKVAARGNR